MTRFPFEEEDRHRFGEFDEWRGCHLVIGRHPSVDPCQPEVSTIRRPMPRRMRLHHPAAASPPRLRAALPRRHRD
jgi:hypothetical protein